jgi:hypothetical protein
MVSGRSPGSGSPQPWPLRWRLRVGVGCPTYPAFGDSVDGSVKGSDRALILARHFAPLYGIAP